MCRGEVVQTGTPRYPRISEQQKSYYERESFIKGRERKEKKHRRAKLKVRRWICAPCVRVKDGGKEVRVKNRKPLRSHQCPQLRDCAEEEQVNFSHWSASLSPLHSTLPLSLSSTSSSSCFSIRSSIMLESAVSRNQAADPPQLLQEEPAPPPRHPRFYGTAEPNGTQPSSIQPQNKNTIIIIIIIIRLLLLLLLLQFSCNLLTSSRK